MEPLSLTSLIIAVILAVERIFNKIKHCRSACCELDMKEINSPKNITLNLKDATTPATNEQILLKESEGSNQVTSN